MARIQRLVLGAVVLFSAVQTAYAAPSGVGLGVLVGQPTGLSAKYWLSDRHAIDGAAAVSLSGGTVFQIHGDYLFHGYDFFNEEGLGGKLPYYYGLGGRIRVNYHHDKETVPAFGLRFPVGITYLANDSPFDLFIEIAPVYDLTPSLLLRVEATAGWRYYF